MSKPSAHSQGNSGRAHLASVFPSGQWAVAQSPAVLGARELRASASAPGQKEVPPPTGSPPACTAPVRRTQKWLEAPHGPSPAS